MGEKFLYLEHYGRTKPLRQKWEGKRTAIGSFIVLIVLGIILLGMAYFQESIIGPETLDEEYFKTAYNFSLLFIALLVVSMIFVIGFILSLLAYFFGKEWAQPELLGVSAEGITLNEKEFMWGNIRTISPLWQSTFHQITQRFNRFGSGEGDLYNLQEKSGAFHQILTLNKDQFERALSKAGAAHLLGVKQMRNPRSHSAAALGFFGWVLLIAGLILKNVILVIIGLPILILALALISKYKL
ncbi:MAG: hypothetical protein ABID38_06030 [Candidatus Diapherotrites archaeon]